MLQPEGFMANHKNVYRLYQEERLADSRRLRVLTLVDDYSRACLAMEVGTSLPEVRVVRVLE